MSSSPPMHLCDEGIDPNNGVECDPADCEALARITPSPSLQPLLHLYVYSPPVDLEDVGVYYLGDGTFEIVNYVGDFPVRVRRSDGAFLIRNIGLSRWFPKMLSAACFRTSVLDVGDNGIRIKIHTDEPWRE